MRRENLSSSYTYTRSKCRGLCDTLCRLCLSPQGTVEFVFGRKMRFVEFREVGHVFVRVYGFLFGQVWSATEFGDKFEGVCGQALNQFIERRSQKLKTV